MRLLPVGSGASSLSIRSCELNISGSGIFNKISHSMSGPRHPRIYPSLVEKTDPHNLIHREKLVKCIFQEQYISLKPPVVYRVIIGASNKPLFYQPAIGRSAS